MNNMVSIVKDRHKYTWKYLKSMPNITGTNTQENGNGEELNENIMAITRIM